MSHDHAADVIARRLASNAAIARRDLDGLTELMMPDISVAVAGGPTLKGRAASRDAFAEQFADPAFDGYVRTTGSVTMRSDDAAEEHGRWIGRWRVGVRVEQQRGAYTAEWSRIGGAWFIASEVFVPLP